MVDTRETAGRIGDLISSALWVDHETPTGKVGRLFDSHRDVDAIAVLGGRPKVALVSRSRFFAQVGQRFGFAVYEGRPVSLLAEEGSTVEIDADPLEVISLATQREAERVYDDILVVEQGRFLGLVSMRSLMVHHKGLLSASIAAVTELDDRNRRLQETQKEQEIALARLIDGLRTPLHAVVGAAHLLRGDPEVANRRGPEVALLLAGSRQILEALAVIERRAKPASNSSPQPDPTVTPLSKVAPLAPLGRG
jgi:signal transduction histidine kinase